MLSIALSSSDDVDIATALGCVISDCRNQLKGHTPQAGIFFTSLMDADFSALLKEINQAFPGIELIGCTTDGEIVAGHGVIHDAVSLLLLSADDIHFASTVATEVSKRSGSSIISAFQKCEMQLEALPGLSIVLPDGLSTIGTPLDTAIQLATGNRYPVFGGTAADHFRLTGTYQFHGDKVYSDALPILMFGGNLAVDFQIRIGPEPIGQRYKITSFENNIVYSINDEPASDFYEGHLGELSKETGIGQFPLAIYVGESEDYYLRDPLTHDKESGSVTFIGNFEENSWVRFTVISREDILNTADDANSKILDAAHGNSNPDVIFIFSCTSRKHTLGSKAKEECKMLKRDDRNIPYFGFYCYGEIGPTSIDGPALFHNDTYIAVSISSGE